jgi:PAS domain S-box-containing protein
MEQKGEQWTEWRRKIIGLGDESHRKTYYAELQKRIEELNVSQADLRTLFNSVSDAIFIHDADGRVRDVNDAMLAMFGVPREEALNYSIREYSAPDYQGDRLNEKLALMKQSGSRLTFEWRARRPGDGSCFEVEVATQVVRWRNEPVVVASVRDISARKQAERQRQELEQQLAQARKMDSIGRLAGGVAHDFNNMLQVIMGNAEMALEQMGPDGDALLREFLEEIRKSGSRSAELTRQLLAFARKQTIQPRTIDLNDTVAGILKMLQRLIGENIELVWKPGADLWPVLMDPSQVDQVLANLCVNARDAISGTGRISLSSSKHVLDETYSEEHAECVPGDYVMISVSDTGCGMDSEVRQHLFEPFFTTKDPGKGTGLGLATVFGIVKQNRGLINVYSEPGKGTTFKIYLPRALGGVMASGDGEMGDLRGTETVLLVEDEGAVMALGRRILEQRGYQVMASLSPKEAVRLATAHDGPIHLLVTDVVMPEMNGKELLDKISATRPDIRCLFMSGYTADIIAHHGVLPEGVQFLQKPFTSQGLARKVRQVLEVKA